MTFLGEIRRRKVFQVAAVYAVVAWLIVQVVSAINEPLNLPDWLDTVVIVLLAIGFPVAIILAWAFDVSPTGVVPAARPEKSDRGHQPVLQGLSHFSQVLILMAVAFLVFDQYFSSTTNAPVANRAGAEARGTETAASPRRIQRFSLDLGVGNVDRFGRRTNQLALSRDGTLLAFLAEESASDATSISGGFDAFRLWLRPLDELEPRLVPGTRGVQEPFFSPDGRWIAYRNVTGGQLEKVSIAGGVPQKLLDGPASTQLGSLTWDGADWSSDGFIYFSDQIEINDRRRAVFRVSEDGGAREQLTLPPTGIDHSWPRILPGNRGVIYTVYERNADDTRNSWIEVHSFDSEETLRLIENAYNARYVPTGHLLFVRNLALWAVPFDIESLQKTGNEAIVIDGIATTSANGKAAYTISDNGLLAYTPGFASYDDRGVRTLTWIGKDGNSSSTGIQPTALGGFRLAPDGDRVAVVRGGDIWVYDIARGTSTRLTTHPAGDYQPLWTPDGERIVFGSTRDGGGLLWRQANGLGDVERLTTSPGTARQHYPDSFSPDGLYLVFTEGQPFGSDIMILPLDDEGQASRLIAAADFDEDFAAVSPDGRWIAYESDETGVTEIYVRPFPNVDDNRWPVSAGGGRQPVWSSDGTELFFLKEEVAGPLLAISVSTETDSEFVFGAPEVVFTRNIPQPGAGPQPAMRYAHHDQRFLVLDQAEAQTVEESAPTIIVDNWFAELERLAPPTE